MKLVMTVDELREALVGLNRDDVVVINVHDDVLTEDNYALYVDVIGTNSNRNEVQLCPVRFSDIENYK